MGGVDDREQLVNNDGNHEMELIVNNSVRTLKVSFICQWLGGTVDCIFY